MLKHLLISSFIQFLVFSIKLDPTTRMFIDDSNRTVIFHGVNVVVKQFPYLPITDHFDPQMSLSSEDIQNLTNWGFNFVRLGVMWESVESSIDSYNTTYLQQVETLINTLGQNGIWTLVDNHQDVFARKICGEGVPDFYAKNLSDKCDGLFGPLLEKFNFCTPFSKFNYTVDSDGNPIIDDCLSRSFVDYYSTPEAADGFQRIYENIDGYQDKLADFWYNVSSFFAKNPYVVGYDLINEPLAANLYKQPWTFIPGVNDLVNLQPLYKRLHSVIRQNDDQKTLFFEPIQGDLLPLLGGMVFPVGFNDTPGGASYNDRQILNDHSYCCQAGAKVCATGEPLITDSKMCKMFNSARVATRAIDAKNLNVGLIISEFGACLDSQACVNEITGVTEACDDNLVGWAYWMFKGFGDFTTSANLQEGFYNNQTLQTGKVKALARTYVQAYQGTPISIKFNTATGHFSTTFALNPNVKAPTVLFVSTQFYYNNTMPAVVVTNTLNLEYNVKCNGNTCDITFPNPQSSNTTITINP